MKGGCAATRANVMAADFSGGWLKRQSAPPMD
jgi:hypothetical protein